MGVFYKSIIKPFFFNMEPERAHELAIASLKLMASVPGLRQAMRSANLVEDSKPVELLGLSFPNRVGLAAGFDKNAVCWKALEALGFGHVEVGTVTFRAQPGNPRPRLFRYPESEALLNRMGFNNDGAAAVAERLSSQLASGSKRIPLGVNIGKSKVAPLDEAVEDYVASFDLLADFADYIAINVSSPNTPDLRKLQEGDRLRELLGALRERNRNREEGKRKPILLKIAPDLNEAQIDAILRIIDELNLSGIIATNTTMSREGAFADLSEAGGLSGKPVEEMATRVIARIASVTNGALPIIGVGGIGDAAAAQRKLDAGASLVQLYSGMIYEGPFLGKRIAKALDLE